MLSATRYTSNYSRFRTFKKYYSIETELIMSEIKRLGFLIFELFVFENIYHANKFCKGNKINVKLSVI